MNRRAADYGVVQHLIMVDGKRRLRLSDEARASILHAAQESGRLHAVLDEALQLLANPIQIQGVVLEKRLAPVPLVEADFGQLRQACVNVVMNACEAMSRGGRLLVETALVEGGRWVEIALPDAP